VIGCEKLRQILDVFALPNFVGGNPSKKCPRYHPGLEPHHLAKFQEVTPTIPKVIDTLLLILSSLLTARPLNFLENPRPGLW